MCALAIAFAVFFIISISSPVLSFGYNAPPHKSDSTLIQSHIREIILRDSLDETNLTDAALLRMSKEQIDSILWNTVGEREVDAHVTWSPDSTFSICVIEMESCGGYCNSEWYSWLHFYDGSGLVIYDAGFGTITEIDVMPDGKYLILDSEHWRSATYGCSSFSANLVSFYKHKIVFHAIEKNKTLIQGHSNDTLTPSFDIHYCSYAAGESSLKYDEKSRQLNYACVEDPGLWNDEDSLTYYSGIYTYTDTSFVLTKKEQHKIRNENY